MAPSGFLRRGSDLAEVQRALTPAHADEEAIQHFRENPERACIPAAAESVPIGLIHRSIFLGGFSRPFHREVHELESCIAFMDKRPLVMDGEMPIEGMGRLALEAGGKVLSDGFIVPREGRCLGHGSCIGFLKAPEATGSRAQPSHPQIIVYAQIIQGSLLATSLGEFSAGGFADQHLLWEPRDLVDGEAFFSRKCLRNGRNVPFLALMDCTGRGVPGAFTAMLRTSFLGHALDREHGPGPREQPEGGFPHHHLR